MNVIPCICETCKIKFNKPKNEYNRKIKLGTPFYCSRKCAKLNCDTSHFNEWKNSLENEIHLSKHRPKKDNLSPFRELFKRVKLRYKENSKKDFDITLNDMKTQWEKQNGLCAYLNLPLILPHTDRSEDKSNPNLIASLDRVGNHMGYVVGNIQFISMTLNYAKNKFNEDTLLNLFDLIENRNVPIFKVAPPP